ncbi:hypothetical protein CDAR_33651 [Caerostris darwini]|uniref:Uncharacterized protein n=1 Tax=Caerostris darwini TaxID=1538125 RepID=A0AAV4S0J4_9ARAC|nr:hypothetical protein CDAR_33651 [Caerostris darwini]
MADDPKSVSYPVAAYKKEEKGIYLKKNISFCIFPSRRILERGISSDSSRKEILLLEELSFLSDRAIPSTKYFSFFAPSQFWSWLGELDMMRDMESQNLSAELCRESCDTGGVEKKYFLFWNIRRQWFEQRKVIEKNS